MYAICGNLVYNNLWHHCIMSFTRKFNDYNSMKKQNEMSEFSGQYSLNVPGNGINVPFMEDPHVRLQHWGANLMTDSANVESELRGLGRVLTHYPKPYTETRTSNPAQINYSSAPEFVDQTRLSAPAWQCKVFDSTRWETPFINPVSVGLKHVDYSFSNNVSTRIQEKDKHVFILDGGEYPV